MLRTTATWIQTQWGGRLPMSLYRTPPPSDLRSLVRQVSPSLKLACRFAVNHLPHSISNSFPRSCSYGPVSCSIPVWTYCHTRDIRSIWMSLCERLKRFHLFFDRGPAALHTDGSKKIWQPTFTLNHPNFIPNPPDPFAGRKSVENSSTLPTLTAAGKTGAVTWNRSKWPTLYKATNLTRRGVPFAELFGDLFAVSSTHSQMDSRAHCPTPLREDLLHR